jgi:aryl-alcohol dehydrogenase-like predicted oxidoreductase
VALNWVLSHPEVTTAITGADTIERLDENLGAIGWTLDAEELARLNELSAFRR